MHRAGPEDGVCGGGDLVESLEFYNIVREGYNKNGLKNVNKS